MAAAPAPSSPDPRLPQPSDAREWLETMTLIRRFALKPLKNDADHARAVNIIGELMGRDLDAGAGDYLDTLILLVNK